MDARFLAECLDHVTFTNAAPADHDQIGPAADEVACGQFFDLHSIKRLWIEVPVEAFQRGVLGKTSLPDAARNGALAPPAGLGTQ